MSITITTLKELNIEEKLTGKGFKKSYIKKHACKYHYIISLLIKKYEKEGWTKNFGYVRLSTSYLDDLIGKARYSDKPNYPDWIVYRIINHLEEFNIIDIRRYYSEPKRRVLKCKLSKTHFKKGFEIYPEEKIEPKFLKRLLDNKKVTPEKYKPIEAIYKKVKLDADAAQKKLDDMIEKGYQLRARRDNKNRVISPVMDVEKASSWQLKIDSFKNFRFTVDEINGGRVYSNATDFPRDLRCYNYLAGHKGEQLYELDIRNSQPLLLSIIVIKWFKDRNEEVPKDVENYKTLCETGNFYNYFREQLEEANISCEDTLKTDVFMKIFFNKESKHRKYKFKKKFDELFPSVGSCLTAMKTESDDEECYKVVSKRLTEIESKIMIDGVSFKLIDKGVEFFPLHDAIYTIEKYTSMIKEVILDEFKKYGITPKVEPKKIIPAEID